METRSTKAKVQDFFDNVTKVANENKSAPLSVATKMELDDQFAQLAKQIQKETEAHELFISMLYLTTDLAKSTQMTMGAMEQRQVTSSIVGAAAGGMFSKALTGVISGYSLAVGAAVANMGALCVSLGETRAKDKNYNTYSIKVKDCIKQRLQQLKAAQQQSTSHDSAASDMSGLRRRR